MSKRRCRLCTNFAIEGSIFCEAHRSRAQLFARSFAAGETTATTPTELEHAVEAAHPAPSAAPAHTPTPAERAIEASPLHHSVLDAFARIAAHAKARTESRWPQISIYFVGEKLLARPYYSIVPSRAGERASGLSPDSDALRLALEPASPVMQEIVARFAERTDDLKSRKLQSLDLHLLTYAGLVALNENPLGKAEKNLAVFDLNGGKIERTTLDAVRPRLRHDRW
jgi:hypothetical protein